MIPDDQRNGHVTLRDLNRVEQGQERILAEIEKLRTLLDGRFDAHATQHERAAEVHDVAHRREADRRAGLIRWAVTTVMTGLGVLTALYVAFQGP
jgi:hypothetical protein